MGAGGGGGGSAVRSQTGRFKTGRRQYKTNRGQGRSKTGQARVCVKWITVCGCRRKRICVCIEGC